MPTETTIPTILTMGDTIRFRLHGTSVRAGTITGILRQRGAAVLQVACPNMSALVPVRLSQVLERLSESHAD